MVLAQIKKATVGELGSFTVLSDREYGKPIQEIHKKDKTYLDFLGDLDDGDDPESEEET